MDTLGVRRVPSSAGKSSPSHRRETGLGGPGGLGLGGTVRHAGLALADGVCGTGAGKWAKTCPGGSWPRAGPAEPRAAAFPSRESSSTEDAAEVLQRGAGEWPPPRLAALQQPPSRREQAAQQKSCHSRRRPEPPPVPRGRGTGRTNPVSGSALGQAACPERPPLQGLSKAAQETEGKNQGKIPQLENPSLRWSCPKIPTLPPGGTAGVQGSGSASGVCSPLSQPRIPYPSR